MLKKSSQFSSQARMKDCVDVAIENQSSQAATVINVAPHDLQKKLVFLVNSSIVQVINYPINFYSFVPTQQLLSGQHQVTSDRPLF